MNNLQNEFEQFMLGECNNLTPKNSDRAGSSPISKTPATPSHIKIKRAEKKYWTLLRAFQAVLERDWVSVDDSLGELMASILNLRQRLYWESQQLQKIKERKKHISLKEFTDASWTISCSSREGRIYLLSHDIELARSHDLRQHELMMSGARSLLANLNQAQESIGRRLEEIMMHDIDSREVFDCNINSILPKIVISLEEIYRDLAAELYRKQLLATQVLESTNNKLLSSQINMITNADTLNDEIRNPCDVANICKVKWSRKSRQSCIQDSKLQELIKLGRNKQFG